MRSGVLLQAAAALVLGAAGCDGGPTRFGFPARDEQGKYFSAQPIAHVDRERAPNAPTIQCQNYRGQKFPWCYAGHEGTDFLLKGGFPVMDSVDIPVVAAAHGEVIFAEDGNYDRCHMEAGFQVTCDGHPMRGNGVKLRHADGIQSLYWHLKKDSVKVRVGDRVVCGELLGYVGSSEISLMPHLHFGVTDAAGAILDPYGDPEKNERSLWVDQETALGRPSDRCSDERTPPQY
ncbi:MAG: M23 family metallopeptidase [Deltaproteobacteria bacterium]|nr:M23 family metallopeptidase [Deltaproteobacteria bacterium]